MDQAEYNELRVRSFIQKHFGRTPSFREWLFSTTSRIALVTTKDENNG
jgi:hypothetical protein